MNPLVRRVNNQSAAGCVFPAALCVLSRECVINSALVSLVKPILEIPDRTAVTDGTVAVTDSVANGIQGSIGSILGGSNEWVEIIIGGLSAGFDEMIIGSNVGVEL